jgi:hypothetical protein
MLFQIDIAAVPPLMKATYIYPELDFGSEIVSTFDVHDFSSIIRGQSLYLCATTLFIN